MPTKRRGRKLPITSLSPSSSSHPLPLGKSSSHKATQAIIASFHTLLKKQQLVQRKLQSAVATKNVNLTSQLEQQLAHITSQIDQLGGIESYQQASLLGQSQMRGGGSSKVLISWLRDLDLIPSSSSHTAKLRMLEIGALTPDNFSKCSWVDNHPIDLNSRHPKIVQQDFLSRPVPSDDDEKFDIISCSLVLNYVADAKDRGEMLKLCRQQLKPRKSSHLFIVLPQPCVINSRYITLQSFRDICQAVGFQLVRERLRPGGKVGYWLWSWGPEDTSAASAHKVKSIQVQGSKLNNFSIIL